MSARRSVSGRFLESQGHSDICLEIVRIYWGKGKLGQISSCIVRFEWLIGSVDKRLKRGTRCPKGRLSRPSSRTKQSRPVPHLRGFLREPWLVPAHRNTEPATDTSAGFLLSRIPTGAHPTVQRASARRISLLEYTNVPSSLLGSFHVRLLELWFRS